MMEQFSSLRRSPGGVFLIVLAVILFPLTLLLWLLLRLLWPRVVHNHVAPGQLGLVAEHPNDLHPHQIALEVRGSRVFEDERLRDAFVDPNRVYTFREDGRSFSLVFADVPRARRAADLIRLVDDINCKIEPPDRPSEPPGKGGERPDQRPSGDGAASRRVRSLLRSGGLAGDVRVSAATLSWLSNAAVEHNGPGSPGARPVAVPPNGTGSTAGTIASLEFLMPPGITFSEPYEKRGQGVDVYILDTLPCDIDMQRAYERWRRGQPRPDWPYPPNELIERLLGPGSPIVEKIYAGGAHLLQQADFFIPDHNYVMSDHGLFVAGIIHTIAPAARLHMVEVLNPYGIGSLESIVHGFSIAASNVAPDAKLLVNASLALDVPNPNDPDWLAQAIKDDPFWGQLTPGQINASVGPFERICALLRRADERRQPGRYPYVGVVAAAGNDNRPGMRKRPPARFPAAFGGVLGIGALNHDNTPAVYSNISDPLPNEAIAAFGGDKDGIYAHQQYGIVGPYIGVFPDGTPNISGWARWAGTSFATPVITGTIAALTSQGNTTFADAVKNIQNAYANPQGTELGETFAAQERAV